MIRIFKGQIVRDTIDPSQQLPAGITMKDPKENAVCVCIDANDTIAFIMKGSPFRNGINVGARADCISKFVCYNLFFQ